MALTRNDWLSLESKKDKESGRAHEGECNVIVPGEFLVGEEHRDENNKDRQRDHLLHDFQLADGHAGFLTEAIAGHLKAVLTGFN